MDGFKLWPRKDLPTAVLNTGNASIAQRMVPESNASEIEGREQGPENGSVLHPVISDCRRHALVPRSVYNTAR